MLDLLTVNKSRLSKWKNLLWLCLVYIKEDSENLCFLLTFCSSYMVQDYSSLIWINYLIDKLFQIQQGAGINYYFIILPADTDKPVLPLQSVQWLAVPSPARVITLQTSLSAATVLCGPVKHIMKISSVMQSEKMIVTLIYGEWLEATRNLPIPLSPPVSCNTAG